MNDHPDTWGAAQTGYYPDDGCTATEHAYFTGDWVRCERSPHGKGSHVAHDASGGVIAWQ